MMTATTALKGMGLAGALQAGGLAVGAAGTVNSINAQNRAASFEARQITAQGKAEQAEATQAAREESRKKDLLVSRARAVSAASGGGLDLELIGDLEGEGEYRTLTALWQGEEAMKGRKAQAASRIASGRAGAKASAIRGFGGALTGGASLMDKYG